MVAPLVVVLVARLLWLAPTAPLPCLAFNPPRLHRQSTFVRRPHHCLHEGHNLLSSPLAAASGAEDIEEVDPAQDLQSFVTQRCIQSFMYLLSETRDLHTVWWLDNFTEPIITNPYQDENRTSSYKPGWGDTFHPNDRR